MLTSLTTTDLMILFILLSLRFRSSRNRTVYR